VLKFLTEGHTATGTEIMLLLVGIVVSFVVSLVAIRFLMDFVKRHSFSPFGVYRIVLGGIVLVYFISKLIFA
jgi:undecaprenyl-diphosphatase